MDIEVKEKTKQILLEKLNQVLVLLRYSNTTYVPSNWFIISIKNGVDTTNKIKFKMVDILDNNRAEALNLLKNYNISFKLSKDKKNYCFYKIV